MPGLELNPSTTSPLVSSSPTLDQSTVVDAGSPNFPPSPEDIGVPADELWDHEAYDYRFCSDHGESEYLLGTADRWMYLSDFDIPDAEATLEAMLQSTRTVLPSSNRTNHNVKQNAGTASFPRCTASSTGANTATESCI